MIVAFALTAGSNGSSSTTTSSSQPLPGVSVPAPPTPDDATQAACVKVFAQLPVQLGSLSPRKTDTDSSFVAAWGNPAIVFRCGVARPAAYDTPGAAEPVDVNGVLWEPDPQKTQTVYTAVDRSVYVDVTVPAQQDQPLPDLTAAVTAIPAVCTGQDAAGNLGNPKLPLCK